MTKSERGISERERKRGRKRERESLLILFILSAFFRHKGQILDDVLEAKKSKNMKKVLTKKI